MARKRTKAGKDTRPPSWQPKQQRARSQLHRERLSQSGARLVQATVSARDVRRLDALQAFAGVGPSAAIAMALTALFEGIDQDEETR